MKHQVLISIGSNINPKTNIKLALDILNEKFGDLIVSKFYESKPFNRPEQSNFINCAVLLETDISPIPLKFDILRKIETDIGRHRSNDTYSERSIDLDIAFYGDQIVDDRSRNIQIPDPSIEKYPFVAVPLRDISPDFIHPKLGISLASLVRNMRDYDLKIVILD